MALIAPVEDGQLAADKIAEQKKKESEDGNKLGYDQFLQLLCAEMQYQDPLEPTSNTDYIAQLATFSQVEATLNMQTALQGMQTNALVGKYVNIKTADSMDSGFVDYVQYENGNQYVYVNGKRYNAADIYEVIDTDYMEAVTLADAFAAAVGKLPDKDQLTIKDLQSVKDLVTVYESLTSYQKSYINQDVLKKYKELVDQMAKLIGDSSEEDKKPEGSGDSTTGGAGDSTTGGADHTEGTTSPTA